MISLNEILNPPTGLSLTEILVFSLILGMLHGATPDEHTWPITFSYAIGKYSTKGGMKAGFLFSLGFTIQRAFLTTLGYVGLAEIYKEYNLDGPVYIVVGFVMAIAGSYILKGKYLHLPIDAILGSKTHDNPKDVPLKMTIVHGLIAGFGFGAYATIITFVLAPQLPSVIYAPLPGLMFGIGTMIMQIIFGAIFGNLLRAKKMSEEEISYIARKSAGRVLYYGGWVFVLAGLLIIAFPIIDNFSISTGFQIPNLDAIDIGFILVVSVVGIIGLLSIIMSYKEAESKDKKQLYLSKKEK
jgi:ABC-type nickel/cobalt efflux system permease component RcnA